MYLIKQFPGISYMELYDITHGSNSLSNIICDTNGKLIVIRDKTPQRITRKNPKVIRSMYFHKDMLDKIEGLVYD